MQQIFYGLVLYNDNTTWITGYQAWAFNMSKLGCLPMLVVLNMDLMVCILFIRDNTDCLGCIIIGKNSNLFINKHFVKVVEAFELRLALVTADGEFIKLIFTLCVKTLAKR